MEFNAGLESWSNQRIIHEVYTLLLNSTQYNNYQTDNKMNQHGLHQGQLTNLT